jgi:hypothetical protein
VTDDPAFYDRALRRIDRIALAIAFAVVAAVFAALGWRDALGCAAGAGLSFLNLRLWKRVAYSVGSEKGTAGRGSPVLLGLRYLLLGGVVFGIIKYTEVSVLAVLAGLLVSVAAVVVEILYELIFASRSA